MRARQCARRFRARAGLPVALALAPAAAGGGAVCVGRAASAHAKARAHAHAKHAHPQDAEQRPQRAQGEVLGRSHGKAERGPRRRRWLRRERAGERGGAGGVGRESVAVGCAEGAGTRAEARIWGGREGERVSDSEGEVECG